ncbi:MAG: alkaline phosphatase family protein [archaeon]
MIAPDYTNSILNFSCSVQQQLRGKPAHAPLPALHGKLHLPLTVIIIDGLGYTFLSKHKQSFLWKHCIGSMTSVFPSTTTAAVTTLMTAQSPAQHGLTGWFMLSKELGAIVIPLRFKTRYGKRALHEDGIRMQDLLFATSILNNSVKSTHLLPNIVKNSPFNRALRGKAIIKGYDDLNGMMKLLVQNRHCTTAYWGKFDHILHHYGVHSKEAEQHFRELDKAIEHASKTLKGTLLITADHGLLDVKHLFLKDHPELEACLALPFCGEPRTVYCYVHPGKDKQFRTYVEKKLKKYCTLLSKQELLRRGWLGKELPSKAIQHRIGDYVLLMKKNYAFYDELLAERRTPHRAEHGGVSADEMLVPLIAVHL